MKKVCVYRSSMSTKDGQRVPYLFLQSNRWSRTNLFNETGLISALTLERSIVDVTDVLSALRNAGFKIEEPIQVIVDSVNKVGESEKDLECYEQAKAAIELIIPCSQRSCIGSPE